MIASQSQWNHALVIGGTGMLQQATIALARRSRRLTAVARTAASLAALARLIGDRGSDRYEALNWNQADEFVLDLQKLVDEVGPPSFVLAWLHDMSLGARVAAAVSPPQRRPGDFFQVIGSSGGNHHGNAKALRDQVAEVSAVRYFQIILGFKREAGASRWLTHDEVSTGVLDAIAKREACHIVGTVHPWEQRPQ
jgi:NADPH:quinone reductase-like Zn-dependent oxidoreductase